MNSKCILCPHFDEAVDHRTTECPILATEQSIKRHDKSVCARKCGTITSEQWRDYVPKSADASPGGQVTILQVQTGRTVRNGKPDITIRDNEKGTCLVIDVAVSRDTRNVIKIETEKTVLYADLTM